MSSPLAPQSVISHTFFFTLQPPFYTLFLSSKMPYDDHVQQKLEKDLYETFEYDPDATATISKRTIRAIDVVDFTMYFAFPSQGPRKQSGAESISEYLLKKHKPLNLAKTAKVIIDEFIVPSMKSLQIHIGLT